MWECLFIAIQVFNEVNILLAGMDISLKIYMAKQPHEQKESCVTVILQMGV